MVLSLSYRKSSKDNLFKKRMPQDGFVFDEQVADVFDDMIVRSIPGYETIISMIGKFAKKHYKSDSKIYDLENLIGDM